MPSGFKYFEDALKEANGDYAQLKLLADSLRDDYSESGRQMLRKVALAMAQAKRKAVLTSSARASPLPPKPIRDVLDRMELQAPDGRALHRYRMSDEQFSALETYLRARATWLAASNTTYDAASLTLWASRWFHRHFEGGLRRYADLGSAIGMNNMPKARWRELLEEGLTWWKRPLIKRKGVQHRLLTVAVEGGFPVRVLEDGHGWSSRYLNEVVGRLAAIGSEPTQDDASDMAEAAKGEVPETYRQDAFIALAADLSLAIVKLRVEAEKAAIGGLTPSEVLDKKSPGWREELPLATDTNAACKLVDGMLAAKKIQRGLSSGAGCARVLRHEEGRWSEGLRLSISGEIRAEDLTDLAAPGTRLRVYPHGALTRVLGGELGILDPPGDDGDSWRLRPLIRNGELSNVLFKECVDVLIRSPSGVAKIIPWPGGAPVINDVVAFEIDEEGEHGPTVLVAAAQGSAKLRASRAVVAAPCDWLVQWEDEGRAGSPRQIGVTETGRGLWLVDASVTVMESANSELAYCVKTDDDEGQRDKIQFSGINPREIESEDGIPIFIGRPKVECFKNRTEMKPASHELLWRDTHGKAWHELAKEPLPFGVVEVLWRDGSTRFVCDRVRLLILPETAQVVRKRDSDGWRYEFQGFGALEVSPEALAGLQADRRQDGTFFLKFNSNPRRRVGFWVNAPGRLMKAIVSLPFPIDNFLSHWDGRIVPFQSEITPALLERLVAVGGRNFTLYCKLNGADIETPEMRVSGTQELGLQALAKHVANDLALAGEGAHVELGFLGVGSNFWRVRSFNAEIRHDRDAVSIRGDFFSEGLDVVVVGRSCTDPCTEHVLISVSSDDVNNRRALPLPDDVTGPWWIYLREGQMLRSRPLIIQSQDDMRDPLTPLTNAEKRELRSKLRAMRHGLAQKNDLAAITLIESESDRRAAIRHVFSSISDSDSAEEVIDWLRQLIGSLNGVPASTFEVLVELVHFPEVLARLLLLSDEEMQPQIWRLEAELPFLWSAIPLETWRLVLHSLWSSTMDSLSKAGIEHSQPAELAMSHLKRTAQLAGSLDPLIAVVLAAADPKIAPEPDWDHDIHGAMQGYVRRSAEDTWETMNPSIFRTEMLKPFIPVEIIARFDARHHESLDAPFAVAAAAQKKGIRLTPTQIWRCKKVKLVDPDYFIEALQAILLDED